MMVRISFACGLYDRTLPLYTGEVRPEGIDLAYVVEENPRHLFDAMAGQQSFEASELSVSEYICRMSAGQCPFVAIPVFVSRVFRHSFIFVNAKCGIRTPKDLEGKRIGTPIYTSTAMVYMRGALTHDFGVDFSQVEWIEGDLRTAGWHADPATMPLLKPARISPNTANVGLNALLAEGGIDALFSQSVPPQLGEHPDVQRLFPDYREVEMDYFRRTRIFPIMHLVAIRRDVYERHPFIARSLYEAFTVAKDAAMEKLLRKGAALSMLPWARAEAAAMQLLFGGDIWPYGVEANRATLESFMGYLVEQDMIEKAMPVEDLFVAST